MTPEEKHEQRQDAIDAHWGAETGLEDKFYESEKKRLLDDKIKNSTKTYEDMEKSDRERGARKEESNKDKLRCSNCKKMVTYILVANEWECDSCLTMNYVNNEEIKMTQKTELAKIRDQLAKTRDLHYTILEVRAKLEREVDNLLETERIEAVRLISWLDKIIEKEIKEAAN